ncbi:hypothetical protein [Ramlibacter sp. 2FC]|uniref:hypothetical protein n=1 Tax=Ramlibacter sp. 2FC TaxID=2502188 RepID=UPI0010F915D2|nr:hypothetical protein [Ramlibacter sp. 2FC]
MARAFPHFFRVNLDRKRQIWTASAGSLHYGGHFSSEAPMYRHALPVFVFLALPLSSTAQQAINLDCPVAKVSPIFDLADFPAGAAMVRMERYRFAIPTGGDSGLASTPRSNSIPTQIVKSETLFQIDFENKRVIIDRMTAEFQVFLQGAEQPFGGGTCTRLEQRKF